jgi:hypothetical protein
VIPVQTSVVGSTSLSTVREIITDALSEIDGLDGRSAPAHADRVASRAAAQASRGLLNLADQLALASALVRNEYWSAKGMTSYDL